MSKAEERIDKAIERALEAYPVIMTTLIPADEEHPLIEQDCNKFKRAAYIEGYRQAEKDLELTWEDVKAIFLLVQVEWSPNKNEEEIYQEVLKRFKEIKKI